MNNAFMPTGVVTEEQWDRASAAPATGLTKREHFAGLAMQGLLANSLVVDIHNKESIKYVAEHAISQADALLAQLEVKS